MKKLFTALSLVFSAIMLLISCGNSSEDAEILRGMLITDNEYSASFRLNMTVADDETEESATLLFAQGNYEVNGKNIEAKMTQVALGVPSSAEISYKDGICETKSGDEVVKEEIEAEEMFGRIIYVKPFVPDKEKITNCKKVTTGSGNGLKIEFEDSKEFLFGLIGEDIYSLATIHNPVKEKTEVNNACITYIHDEKAITGMTVSFDLKLYDTPPYVPGISPDYEKYSLVINVNYTVTYN